TDITKVVISSADVTLASGAFETDKKIEFVGNDFQWKEVTSDAYTNVTCNGGTVTLESKSSDAVLVSYTDIKVFKIPAGKTVSDIEGFFKTYDGCTLEASDNKTGATITIKSANNAKSLSLTLIVSGDIDKDGDVDKDDVGALIGGLSELGGTALTGDAFKAADIDNDCDNDTDDLFALAGKIGTDTDQKYIIDKTASGEKAYILNIQTGEYVNYVMFAVNCTDSTGVSVTGGCNPKTVSKTATKVIVWVDVTGKEEVTVTVEFGSKQNSFSTSDLKAITASGKIRSGQNVTAPAAPSVTTFSANSITISSVSGYEYGCSTSSTSCSSFKAATGSTLTFDGLAASTKYYIFY
ncbi:MAG: hypothetical protein KBS59_07330, partial [Clostridiales bacterium]|nr:hypothetical protein [Clostridiales bacterium]